MIFIRILASLLARLPERWIGRISAFAGDAIFLLARKRRRGILSNLRHAFPEKDPRWHRQNARESLRQMVEFGLLGVALPSLSEERLRQIFLLTPSSVEVLKKKARSGRPVVAFVAHLGPQEGFLLLPLLVPELPPIGTIYRPLNNQALNQWILDSRQRFGMRLISRKEGIQEGIRMLRRGNWLAVLFDQNSGRHGSLLTFLDRLASVTDLPAILATRHEAETIYGYSGRRACWRIDLHVEEGPRGTDKEEMTIAANRWLEDLLRNDQLRPSWLWAHNRWRHQRVPPLGLREKKNLLKPQNRSIGRTVIPRREPVFVRIPNWLGDVVMMLPLLRAIRESRPDVSITVIGKAPFLPLISGCGLCEETIPLPPRGPGYFPFFWKLRPRLPLLHLLFTNSSRGDIEAWLTGAPHRFGMIRPGKKRPLLTKAWEVPADLDETACHQVEVWERFLRHFELEGPVDLSPVTYPNLPPMATGRSVVGMICGTENFPAKRWPVARWRDLIQALLDQEPEVMIRLFGTANDRAITHQVSDGFPPDRVENLAGSTSLPDFMAHLAACRIVISNDTGGMHLANAMGVPVAGLFGPTNPVRTGPVFLAPRSIIQPRGCPPTGGASMEEITVEQVLQAIGPLLKKAPAADAQ
jgi:heptosyltransferase II